MKKTNLVMWVIAFGLFFNQTAQSQNTLLQKNEKVTIDRAQRKNSTTIDILLSNGENMQLDFYDNNIFRLFQDNSGGEMRDPIAKPPANILVNDARKPIGEIIIKDEKNILSIATSHIEISFDKGTTLFAVKDLTTHKIAFRTKAPIILEKTKYVITLDSSDDEYFYGGGVQNGRFSHKGKAIAIENQNSWTDGGVASPTPFYWSTNGYAFMGYTFKKGTYDFDSKNDNRVVLSHDADYLDVFFMINDGMVPLLNDFYQLTGHPVLIPKMGFYQGHLNAYNRDYWVEDSTGILFENGKRYKESQKDNGGVQESLNGEKNNYMFSARGVIDRYHHHDMPLGWILPNDGYGAGYGQTSSLEGNIQNLKQFGDYARSKGVEIGLWTQSDLHPKEGIEPLLQRDIINEVGVAGVKVLKTDVAWVGAGYSFGLNGVQDVATIMPKYGNGARPFIISLDGWAGTQHYATIWTGDQTGGQWEYIRFHIPTYIGSGLSGQPNISSDMDGIFGGKNATVNIRDFQWKTFSLMQLNMDGWGSNEKYPHALGESATSINRNYLKWKSALLPYAYSIAHESVNGLPSVRAMFLEEANPYTLGKNTQYQYMYGPSFLIAPIYQNTHADAEGNDIRNNIYLPKGEWIDYFSGEKYSGGRIINNIDFPIWKLPVFIKNGAIIPMVNPNNNPSEINRSHRIFEVYPHGSTTFTLYDDDGVTIDYLKDKYTKTVINSSTKKNEAQIEILPAIGYFDGFVQEQTTEFVINVTKEPRSLKAKVGSKSKKLKQARTIKEFDAETNVYFYDASPQLNKFSTPGSKFADISVTKNPQLRVKLEKTNITKNKISLHVKGFEFAPQNTLLRKTGSVSNVQHIEVADTNATAYTLKPSWEAIDNADYYELELDGIIYSTIRNNSFEIENLRPETTYNFKARAVNKEGSSPTWTAFSAVTKKDPLEFAIKNIVAETTSAMQGGQGVNKFFDFDEGNMVHSKYGEDALPFEMIIDLQSINQINKLIYLPRDNGKNGMIQTVSVAHSMDKNRWTEVGEYEWATDYEGKTVKFIGEPTARYIKLKVTKSVGNFISGRELYIFKVPGTESYIPGDINNDKIIDHNDLTSYMNYTGLRLGDADFEGYVSRGDVNKNNMIDAYDISNVATRLDGGVNRRSADSLQGTLFISPNIVDYKSGDVVEIRVRGKELKSVNAFSFAMPYNVNDFDFMGITVIGTKQMVNFTKDRLHTDGEKVLYPTFVNVGNQETLNGNEELFVIRMKAKREGKFSLKVTNGLLVDKRLNAIEF